MGFRFHRKDRNHTSLVADLRTMGLSAHDTHMVGGGFPDAVIGGFGVTGLLEIKYGKNTLLDTQKHFDDTWRGSRVIVGDNALIIYKAFREYAQTPLKR